MARLVIFGAGDIARLAHTYFTQDSPYEVVGFVTDGEHRKADSFLGLPWIDVDRLDARFPATEHEMFVALSYTQMNRARATKYAAMKEAGYRLASYVSSRCTYLSSVAPGDNCFILEDNTIQPFVTIGNNVTLWSGNHIGHDSTIGNHCFITSHVVVSGHCHVADYCFIGVNSTLRNSITIGEATLIGAGSIVMRDTQPKSVYVPERTKVFSKTSDEIEL
jgi:sugar O-acyltransferase (sialic acid O-acetyltransferase NeuD family)